MHVMGRVQEQILGVNENLGVILSTLPTVRDTNEVLEAYAAFQN